MTIDTVETQGIRMRYARFGEGKNCLVILPGLSVGHVTDAAQAVRKAYQPYFSNYSVYLFDRRDNISEGYSMRDMADDTAAVMKELGIEQADVCGASQGGMIALYLAAFYPELVHSLLLCSTAAKLEPWSEEIFRNWSELARSGDRKALSVSFNTHLYSEKTLKALGDFVSVSTSRSTEKDLAHFTVCDEALLNCTVYDVLDRISCPALVIGCEGDLVFGPAASETIAQAIHGQLYLYGKEYGHAVFDEAPDYIPRMQAFLKTLGRC